MPTFPDKAQRPQQETAKACSKCGGSGRVRLVVKGVATSQPCIQCRGTGQAGGGFQSK
jgi:DnaJ-class molecular chaperone